MSQKFTNNNCTTIPFLTYEAQTWALTKEEEERMRITQRKMERYILGIGRKGKKRNKAARERTGAKYISYIIKKLKGVFYWTCGQG